MLKTSVVIEVPPPEFDHFRGPFDEMAESLRAAGFDARLERAEFEKRSAILEVVVRVLEDVEAEAITAIVSALGGYLRGRARGRDKRRRARVVIHGPRGEVLRSVEVDSDDVEE